MLRSFLLPVALLTAAPALGCRDQATPTEPVAQSPSLPAYRAEKFIFGNAFILGGDPSNPLALQAGFDAGVTATEICADPFGQNLNGIGPVVLTPPGGYHQSAHASDMEFVVYQYGGGIVSDPCQVAGAPIVGTGTGAFSYMTEISGRGVVVIHVTAHGTIDLAAGGQARVFALARVTVRPDGTLQFDEELVRLTPL